MVSANASPPEQEPEVEASKRIVDGSKATGKEDRQSKNKLQVFIKANKKRLPFIIFVIVVAAVGSHLLWPSHAEETSTASTNIDYSSQSAVNKAYWDLYAPSRTAYANWTGSTSSCRAGAMSTATRNLQVDAINFMRRLQQLKPVSARDSIANANVMKAGLMLEAKHYNLSNGHPNPSLNWPCYSSAGAATISKSNLGQEGHGVSVGDYMNDMMSDYGETAVGHRRWLSLPEANVFGVGTTKNYTVVQVIGLSTSTSNPSPSVMWPMKGYFPSTLAPANIWSYSSGRTNTDFSASNVRVTHNGNTVKVTKYTPIDGYGRPTLTWAMPWNYATSGTYTVRISNIHSGSATTSTSYKVHFFDPVQATLKLVKQVNNNYGGTKTSHDWTLKATGADGFSDRGDSTTFHSVDAGVTYSLSESNIAGYTAVGNYSCNGGNQNGNTITLSFGQNITCTITNNDIAPTLTIVKSVAISHGGTKHANDFSIKVNGIQLTGGVLSSDGLTETYTYSNPAINTSYMVSEDQLTGYTQISLNCVDNNTHLAVTNPVSLSLGQNITCTITNSYQ